MCNHKLENINGIQITEGDKEGVTSWLGPQLGDVPVVLSATKNLYIKDFVTRRIYAEPFDVLVEFRKLAGILSVGSHFPL